MRKKRIVCWLIVFFLAFNVAFLYEGYTDKKAITIYAPEDMKSAFERMLQAENLKHDHKIVITDDKSVADICVECGKENYPSYTEIAFSPFVVAYTPNSNMQKLHNANILITSKYNKQYYDVDFFEIIKIVIGDGKLSPPGGDLQNKIKVFYPDKTSPYWQDFYDFMIVTLNNGKYPKLTCKLREAEKLIEKFTESKYTEGVKDFKKSISDTGGFTEDNFWILPEQNLLNMELDSVVFYPIKTIYLKYYVKDCTKLGRNLINTVNQDDFYYALYKSGYRSKKYLRIETTYEKVYGERNNYYVEIWINKNLIY